MRIAIGGFHIESCTFSPLMTPGDDFFVQRGEDLLNEYAFFSRFADINLFPLVRARAVPGGPVERSFYDSIKNELIGGLQNEPAWDGVLLLLHGAVYVDGLEDAEGDLVEAIRGVVGKDCLIAASYDLHGNVSKRVIDAIDILSAYRTAPHVDVYETIERTFNILVNCLQQRIRPYLSFVPVPILLAGEQTSTEWEPARRLYSLIPQVINRYNLIDASILIGYLWADEPRATASVISEGTDLKKTQEGAIFLAEQMWNVRNEFKFGVQAGPVDECIKIAMNHPDKPVFISDSGDNVTAGAAGDVPYVLERLISLKAPDVVFASIVDEEAVAACEISGKGAEVLLSLGGKRDDVNGKPLRVLGTVLNIYQVPLSVGGSKKGSKTNKTIVFQVQGIKVIITQRRMPFLRISDFEAVGIDPRDYKIIVVKLGYLEPEFKEAASLALLALSPGAVNQTIAELEFRRISRPKFPFDPKMEWVPSIT